MIHAGNLGVVRRGMAALALVGVALLALPAGADPRGGFGARGGVRSGNLGFGSGFRTSRFGLGGGFGSSRFRFSIGGGNWRMSYGFSRHYNSVPRYSFGYTYYYPSYFGGLYPYPYVGYSSPFTTYGYTAPRPRTIYIYPPPVVREYSVTPPPSGREEPQRGTPHPYDNPVSPSPEKGSVDEALMQIRTAWLKQDVEALRPYLPTKGDIAIYRDGDLRQELSAEEFIRLNQEAFRQIRTVSFRFTDVRHPAADAATATATHTYIAIDGDERDAQTATLEYELVRRDDLWTIQSVRVKPVE